MGHGSGKVFTILEQLMISSKTCILLVSVNLAILIVAILMILDFSIVLQD